MTIKQLKKAIAKMPDDAVVVLSSDAEGNGFHGLYEVAPPDNSFADNGIQKAVVFWADDEYMEPSFEDDEG